MNTPPNGSKSKAALLALSMLIIAMGGLLSCEQQPKSIFEQQAESKSTEELAIDEENKVLIAPVETAASTNNNVNSNANNSTNTNVTDTLERQDVIKINKQQAIARQPNCDASKKSCQYFELNVLKFIPEQPWLTSIMWKTIAQVLVPEAPLASQDQAAKNKILMLLKQVEYADNETNTLPMYGRIDTELVLHPITNSDTNKQGAPTTMATGYLLVRSTEERGSSTQHLNYVMLDVEKKLQLTIEDILVAKDSKDQLLTSLQKARKDWLVSKGMVETDGDKRLLQLSSQWYLDEQGLHMVYRSGELIKAQTHTVDLIVPYRLLIGLIKPSYVVKKSS